MTVSKAARAPSIVKAKVGHVVSDRMEKTIVVRVDTLTPHPIYKKRVRKSKRFVAHDQDNQARIGDFVRIVESRPRSKTKSWRLESIVRSSRMPTRDELEAAEAGEER